MSSNNTAVFPEPRRAAPPEQNAVVCSPFGGKSDREQTNDGKLLLPLQRDTICFLYLQLTGVLLMHYSQFIREMSNTTFSQPQKLKYVDLCCQESTDPQQSTIYYHQISQNFPMYIKKQHWKVSSVSV